MSTGRVVGIVGIVLVALIGAFTIAGVFLPNDYRVERTLAVQASPETVYEQIIDLENHEAWNPWRTRDPTMRWSFGDSRRGPGAVYTWTSENSGSGTYTITEAVPHERVASRIRFEGMGSSDGYFLLEPRDGGTQVTWGFSGTNPGILGAWFSLAMDPLVGADFEVGLLGLKEAAESAPSPLPPIRPGGVRGVLTLSPDGDTFQVCGEARPRPFRESMGDLLDGLRARAADGPLDAFAEIGATPYDGDGVHGTALHTLVVEGSMAGCDAPLPEGHIITGGEDPTWMARAGDGAMVLDTPPTGTLTLDATEDGAGWSATTPDGEAVRLVAREVTLCELPSRRMITTRDATLTVGERTYTGCTRVGMGGR
jgi:uncharacterized protein YndB with AHSA1/START domain/uncharacterized membrane protein